MIPGWWAVTEHRLRTARAYAWSLAMGSVANPAFYLLALGVGLGAVVNGTTGSKGVDGVPYLTFVGPALLASSAITAGFEETAFPTMSGFKWTREFWGMHAAPIRPGEIATGVVAFATLRMLVTATVYFLFLWAFGAVPSAFGALAIVASLLAGLAMAGPMMAVAASLENDDGWFALINRMVVAPMFLFSGTFYPLNSLPLFLQPVGWISPLWHATELGRVAAYGSAVPPWLIAVHILYPLALAVGGLTLAGRIFHRRLTK